MKYTVAAMLLLVGCTDSSLTPEKKQEIMSNPQVEMWGPTTVYVKSDPVVRPFERIPGDGGTFEVYPENFVEDSSPKWVRHSIILSVWAKGDPEVMEKFLERWAEDGFKKATSYALKK